MNWKKLRRGKFSGDSEDGQVSYMVMPKRNGQYFIKAYLVGGAEHRLPFQSFETAQAAMDWVEQYEQERAERNACYAQEGEDDDLWRNNRDVDQENPVNVSTGAWRAIFARNPEAW